MRAAKSGLQGVVGIHRADGVIVGTMAGMVATLLKDIPNYLLFRLGVIDLPYWRLAASTFVLPEDADEPLSLALGGAADIIIGGILGMIILMVLIYFGFDAWWYKGLVASGAVWLLGAGLGVNTFVRLVPVDPLFRFFSLFDHLIFGLSAVYIIRRWYGPPR
ncbi:MAG: hypothetical protein ACM3XS_06200 [Bacteroidota bacterium]